MPGFLGGSGGSSAGTSGEITFPKEFIDPVTKLRISQPENLIDTDFEYGLQPTKWETVELINNTPSFFSKSGDTTIPNILSISTNNGTREITVVTAIEHGLAVGIPINVTGTKSVTADGSYIINSIPNPTTFTYLCKDNQQGNNAIEDLYTSIITGEFFQGSQIRILDADGIVTNAAATSVLTVTTESTHGFGLNTPFYFLNLNSTISQEFEASNTAAKQFDSSNSATAQTFDGSNTLSTFNIDWSNSATVGGTTSTITNVNTANDTIIVTHGAETFANQPIGTPLYYNLSSAASSGYFFDNPRGVVFLKTVNSLNVSGVSTFQVSAVPDGDTIDIVSSMSGTMQLANQARTFSGNNVNPNTEKSITIIEDSAQVFDAANNRIINSITLTNRTATVTSYSGSLVNVSSDSGVNNLDFYTGSMVLYTSTGSAASGLSNNTTYFIDNFFSTGGINYAFTLKPLPTGSPLTSISGGTGVQKFSAIGVSLDKDIFHIKNHGFAVKDMLRYEFPAGGGQRFTCTVPADDVSHYFVETVYDSHNFDLGSGLNLVGVASGLGVVAQDISYSGTAYKTARFLTAGSGGTITFTGTGVVDYLVVAGGGGGGSDMGGGGGAGGLLSGSFTTNGGTYQITVGNGGNGANAGQGQGRGQNGSNSVFTGPVVGTITAIGGGGGASNHDQSNNPAGNGGSGGGASGGAGGAQGGSGYGGGRWGLGTAGQGNQGGVGGGYWYPSGGGGATQAGTSSGGNPKGGDGAVSILLGTSYIFAGGGGGSGYSQNGGNGGAGGGGGGAVGGTSGGVGINNGSAGGGGGTGTWAQTPGGNAGANTGGGGGGGAHYNSNNYGGTGGRGIVILRWKA